MSELEDLAQWEHELHDAGVVSDHREAQVVGRSFSIEEAEAISASRAQRHALVCPFRERQDVTAELAFPPRTEDRCALCEAPFSAVIVGRTLRAPGAAAHEHVTAICDRCGVMTIRCDASGDVERRQLAPRFVVALRARLLRP